MFVSKFSGFSGRVALLVFPLAGLVVGSVASSRVHAGSMYDAADVLRSIMIENEHTSGYNRSLFPLWKDIDGDKCDSRQQVLKRDSISLPQVDPFKCKVIEGDWVSPYDGALWTDPLDLDIDHVVALKETWDSGAWSWTTPQRQLYANDTSDSRTLLAVTDNVNQSKGDKDPSNWLPPLESYLCTYIGDWISIKARWGLSMDKSEAGRVRNLLAASCAGLRIVAWPLAPGGIAGVLVATTTTIVASATTLPPRTTTSTTTTTTTTTTIVASATTLPPRTTTTTTGLRRISVAVKVGDFCSPAGLRGTKNAQTYVCSRSNAFGVRYKDSRARWRLG